mmetsp:Transcript_5238/g.8014  ORF Transcript_5238/g.8014 Transcript_5238/m.8014 type:complete len:187 (-) Transcript_5238:1818-2378(-)
MRRIFVLSLMLLLETASSRRFTPLVIVSSVLGLVNCKKDWSQLDLDKLEKSWQDGDDEEELKTKGDHLYEEIDKKESQGAVGATIMFCKVLDDFSQAQVGTLVDKIHTLTRNGGVEVKVYTVSSHKLVVGIQKGWHGEDIFKLLNSLPEIETVEWKDREQAQAYRKKQEEERKRLAMKLKRKKDEL